MGKFVLTNVRLFTGGADLTGASNKLEISAEVADEDATTFGSGGWKEVKAGLAATEITAEGFWEAGDLSMVDDAQWTALGGLGPWSAGPAGANVGDLAYFTNALTGSYALGGEVGSMAPWSGKANSSWPLVRGQVAHPPGTARTASGTGVGTQLGAVPAGKQLYAALHVLSVAGTATPSLTVAIESDTASGFAAPTDRLTFAAATARGGQILRVPGPLTDTWFRPKWTVAGTAPSFLFVVALGIA
ncbi:hypothetical protein [Amycolatopsis methanolica]|uniref:Uncharacterized protein n=1 Tax=Amycolatopsis methanolica 239 TaxID=1068978 RepID=A0A076N533_AMYME|nr:hypothetical protein [Amycolatopsis methanolica]AIJ26362.1 hypothetical protein AMETH_6270 [Amycolatopsis methanolica 239]AIJ26421.1 hypothetical protein AMETH_6329 [Amycolatopsis methanolica 239]